MAYRSVERRRAALWLGVRRQLAIRVGNGAARARLLFKGAGGVENTTNLRGWGGDGAPAAAESVMDTMAR